MLLLYITVCRAEIWPFVVSVCGRGCRREAHGGRRFHNGATVGSATGRGASVQRLHPPAIKSKETSIYVVSLSTLIFLIYNVGAVSYTILTISLHFCSNPQSIQTTSIYASSVLCTSRTSKEHTSTSRRRDTRKTSRLGDLKFLH